MAHSCPDSRAATSAPFSPRGEMTKCLHGRQKTRPKISAGPLPAPGTARRESKRQEPVTIRSVRATRENIPDKVPRTPKTSRNPPGKTLSSCLPASPHRPLVKKIFPSNEKQIFLKREKNSPCTRKTGMERAKVNIHSQNIHLFHEKGNTPQCPESHMA